ncbi:MAG: class I SAM-dependent methyltransferase [Omnitrophica WOR_2 bacterium]
MPDRHRPFADKAEYYARYRWDYARPAIDLIFEKAGLSRLSVVADIGAGTGILTRHFVSRVGRVYAIEPEPEMRMIAEGLFENEPSFTSLGTTAEATGLPDASVDFIAVGQAIHWFNPQSARGEFLRILKPGGWLAILWNEDATPGLDEALRTVCIPENGWQPAKNRQEVVPLDYYYPEHGHQIYSYSQMIREPWGVFIGALVSDSHAPNSGDALYSRFEAAAREVFERFNTGGFLQVSCRTELCLGQVRQHGA